MIYTSLGILISKSLLINNKLDIADPVKNIFFWFWLARGKKKQRKQDDEKEKEDFLFLKKEL
jgi:hypothetical protein